MQQPGTRGEGGEEGAAAGKYCPLEASRPPPAGAPRTARSSGGPPAPLGDQALLWGTAQLFPPPLFQVPEIFT